MNTASITGVDVTTKGSLENIRSATESSAQRDIQKHEAPEAKDESRGNEIDVKA